MDRENYARTHEQYLVASGCQHCKTCQLFNKSSWKKCGAASAQRLPPLEAAMMDPSPARNERVLELFLVATGRIQS